MTTDLADLLDARQAAERRLDVLRARLDEPSDYWATGSDWEYAYEQALARLLDLDTEIAAHDEVAR